MGCTDTGLRKRIDVVHIKDGSVWRRMESEWRAFPPYDPGDPVQAGRPLTPAEVERAERGEGPDWTAAKLRSERARLRDLGAPTHGIDDAIEAADERERGEGPALSHEVSGPVAGDDCGVCGRHIPHGELHVQQCIDTRRAFRVGSTFGGSKSFEIADGRSVRVTWSEERAITAPAGLTPEQATRYGDATAATLRRLVAEYGAAELGAEIDAWVTPSGPRRAEWDRAVERQYALAEGRRVISRALACYVAFGTPPADDMDRSAEFSASRAGYLERVKAHVAAALVGEPCAVPSADALGTDVPR